MIFVQAELLKRFLVQTEKMKYSLVLFITVVEKTRGIYVVILLVLLVMSKILFLT